MILATVCRMDCQGARLEAVAGVQELGDGDVDQCGGHGHGEVYF